MKEEVKSYISPLVSFDIYLEYYHKLLRQLRRKNNLTQLQSIVKNEIALTIKDAILQEDYDALVLTGSNQNIIWVSEGFQEMTGYSKNFAIGKRPSFLQGIKTSKNTKQEIREQLQTEHTFTGSILNYRKNGQPYLCQIKIVPIYDSNNVLKNFLALEKEKLAA
ncbi:MULTISPECIES: PAS domain-containing protein [Flavobacteriaceae]|uniref:PAS domain-containing protein n=1 Tax=Flavobacteriaceae TaxID=49546 RepID=UPI0023490000|nr:PAS domain-containing protein [Muricauda sp. SP22]MDC6361731.1 PAS domain-containing protein [Muricauda sp. SP22]